MIDHVSIPVRDFEASKAFYERVLAPIGYTKLMEVPGAVGFGMGGKPDLWLETANAKVATLHVAVRAMDREAVHGFHREALAAGGRDNGPPGPRPNYGPTYYAAFVHDPDGHNLEVVCHCAEGE